MTLPKLKCGSKGLVKPKIAKPIVKSGLRLLFAVLAENSRSHWSTGNAEQHYLEACPSRGLELSNTNGQNGGVKLRRVKLHTPRKSLPLRPKCYENGLLHLQHDILPAGIQPIGSILGHNLQRHRPFQGIVLLRGHTQHIISADVGHDEFVSSEAKSVFAWPQLG